ncbi:WD40/YVTN/BNR-like repeat-containing protein [Streptomyces sp. NRAIS4]
MAKSNDGGTGHEERLLPLEQRNRELEWRARWFAATRSDDEVALGKARDASFAHKLRLVEEYGQKAGAIAGYDPAGSGSPWYPLGPRNVNGRVKALAVHPTDPETVYAGAASGGVWKSTDGGQTWDALWDMQESLAIGAIGIAASNPDILYVGTGEYTPGYGPSYAGAGVYVSADGGATWSRRAAVSSRRIGKLVVDPTDSQRLWVSGDAGLERSDDGGQNWTSLRTDTVTDIALDPTNASTLFIAVGYSGFYKSTDRGATFTLLPGAPTGTGVQKWPQLAIGATGAHGHNFIVIKMGATVQQSTDGGATFTAVAGTHSGFFPGWCDVIACAPDDESVLFWGGIGLDRTADGGATWSGLPVHADQHAVVFAPSNSNVVYIANDGGVWRSDNKGATVRKVSNGLIITQFYNINFWRSLSNVLGGGAQDNATNYTTSGLTWRPVWTNDGGWFVIDPTDPRVMYAEGQNAYLAKSTNGGATWDPKTAGIVGSTPWEGVLTMDPNDHLRLYYGTDRVLRTLDGMATAWTSCSQVFTGEVSAIAVAPSDSGRVYAGTGDGHLYRTDDGGTTTNWADKTGSFPTRGISSIWVDPANADHLVISLGGISGAAGAAQSVWSSTNGGSAWTDLSGDLPRVVANAVVVDPASSSTLYLATDTGVYRSTDSGARWLPFDNGIPNVPVSDLVIDSASHILYAGTMGRGAFKLDITPGVSKQPVDLYLRDDDLDTAERFPTPTGLPDPLVPAPATADWWTSPDIKVNHAPYFTPAGVFDGVDFDATLIHQDPYRGRTNRFYIQVHNRGWQTTQNVSVRAFVADASAGLPDLPNVLTPPAFNLTSTTAWQPIGASQTIPELHPNRPVVLTWDYALPAGTATHSCCLVVASCPDDPFTSSAVDIPTLVTSDKHASLKNLHVIDPGPEPRPILVGIDFHNASERKVLADLLVRPTGFENGTIGLLLPPIEPKELVGVVREPLAEDDSVGTWYNPGCNNTNGLDTRWKEVDRSSIWLFDSMRVAELRGITIGGNSSLSGIMVLQAKSDPDATTRPRVAIAQRQNGAVVGGSTFQIGYDLPLGLTYPAARRIRIDAERIAWPNGAVRPETAGLLWSKVTVDDDPDRSHVMPLCDIDGLTEQRACLFDGLLIDGVSLTLEVIAAENPCADRTECLYIRRFESGLASWLGEHTGRSGQLHLDYRIQEILPTILSETD